MKTIKCIINFRDGAQAVATASAASPDHEVEISYEGALMKLGDECQKGCLDFVEWYLRARAQHMGAQFEVETEGEF